MKKSTSPSSALPEGPAPQRFHGLAWSALILGIIGTVFSIAPFFDVITMLGAIVGFIFGITVMSCSRKIVGGISTGPCVLSAIGGGFGNVAKCLTLWSSLIADG